MSEPSENEILAHCDPQFADAWLHAESGRVLLGSSIDAMGIMELGPDDKATIPFRKLAFGDIFGERLPEWRENFFMRVTRQDRATFIDACRQAAQCDHPIGIQAAFRQAEENGSHRKPIHVRLSVQKVGSWDDKIYLYLTIKDFSAKYREDLSLTRGQYASSLRAIFNEVVLIDLDTGTSTPIYLDGCPLTDDDGNYVDCGLHRLFNSLHPEDKRTFWRHASHTNVERTLFGEGCEDATLAFDLRRKEGDGAYHWTSVIFTRVAYGDERRVVLLCLRNIDEQKEAQRRERILRSRAQIDALTGIYNRGTTEELVTVALEAAAPDDCPLFVVFDVDNFKHVNDTYGHLMGDELLKCVARSIKSISRETDIVGRVGGDEFVALLTGEAAVATAAIKERVDRCEESLRKFSEEKGIQPAVTLSIGIVPVTEEVMNYHDAFALADQMLYTAKNEGKNGYRLYQP